MKTLLIGINSKYIHPAMGIYQLVANSKSDICFKEFTIKDHVETIVNYINLQEYDLLGFSVYIWNINNVKKILKAITSGKPIVLGGPEVSYRYNDFFGFDNVSFIVKNEGECSFNELIDYLEGKILISNVSNLYYRNSLNTQGFTFTFECLPDIDSIKHDYTLIGDYQNRIVYLESSRGCPFRCSYCLASLEKKVRQFDINKVKNEIIFAIKNKAKTVKFLDRSFNINQKYMQEILQFINEVDNHHTTFQFEIVGDMLDEETINTIKNLRKGLVRFEIGIQSTNEIVTKAVRRIQNFEILKSNIKKIKANVTIHLDLIAGLPYEDKDSFISTFNQTFSLYCEELQLGFLKELKGTYISESQAEHGYLFDQNPPYEIIKNKYISENELDEIRLVEAGLNKYYNSSNYPKTMNYLFIEKKLNPYETFLKLGQSLKKHPINLQIADVSKLLYENFPHDKILFYIKQDYLMLQPIKPKIWWVTDINKNHRQIIYNKFIKTYPQLDMETLYRYSRLEYFENTYFVVTSKPHNIYFLIV